MYIHTTITYLNGKSGVQLLTFLIQCFNLLTCVESPGSVLLFNRKNTSTSLTD